MASNLQEGERAPDFTLPDDTGEPVNLHDRLEEGPAMLVFYPGDFTPVCTRQLCNYRDNYGQFRELGVQVFGISDDPVERHAEFREAEQLPFRLLADPDKEVIDEYTGSGLLSGGGAHRGNFIIDRDGIIRYAHVETVSLFRRKADELLEAARQVVGEK